MAESRGPRHFLLGLAALACCALPSVGARSRIASSPPFEVSEASISDLQAALSSGRVTSHQLVEAYLRRIAAYDQQGPSLNAIVTLNPAALAQADALDRERQAKGPRGPLHGIPVLVKDNFDTADMPTSGGSLALATLQPTEDAFQVARLRAAGAIILGKTAMHELASGVITISSLTGQTRNPYDLARSPGGSSGGTGAAVAASFAAAGMGTDTCGSIRIPSAYQNLFGLRATRGLSSRTGVMPLSSTQDVAGPLARSVADLAIMLDATVGNDPRDRSTAIADAHVPASYSQSLRPDGLKGARIGVVRALFGTSPEEAEGQAVVDRALATMRAQGAVIVDAAIPDMRDLLADSGMIPFEFKYDLADYLARHPHAPVASLQEILDRGLDHDVLDPLLRRRAPPGPRDEAGYQKALANRRALHDATVKLIADEKLDALLYPTNLLRPPLIGGDTVAFPTNCQFSATTGLPAIAIPAGFSARGLPVGIELLGADFTEPRLLGLAYGWEQAARPRKAPFSTPPLLRDGRAPGPIAFGVSIAAKNGAKAGLRLRYDPLTASLEAHSRISGLGGARFIALTLQRAGDNSAPGPVIAHFLIAEHTSGTSNIILTSRDRDDLFAGRLYAVLYTTDAPLGAGQSTIMPPRQ